jgi:glycosyltransferase involved in cell wall biosynthesis
MQCSVSVVIPSFNQGAFLQETMQSIEDARSPALREV